MRITFLMTGESELRIFFGNVHPKKRMRTPFALWAFEQGKKIPEITKELAIE